MQKKNEIHSVKHFVKRKVSIKKNQYSVHHSSVIQNHINLNMVKERKIVYDFYLPE